ncbi:FtsX-like permease family protein [Catenuloplanes japonicus]|uniref:FtsX-like permease family protein n=1 Tax=Catenuloplanes japonicus TaxID=33876 RepID=UPI000526DEA2|nr:FtsX-like permease family protein [Catenuloplanes japonicus]
MRLLRRVRAGAGPLALLAALCLLATFLMTGLVRTVDDRTDAGLRQDLAALPPIVRDLRFVHERGPTEGVHVSAARDRLAPIRASLPAPLRDAVGEGWSGAQAGPDEMTMPVGSGDCTPPVTLRQQTGTTNAIRGYEGRAPASAGRDVEVALSREAAAAVGVRVGHSFTLAGAVEARLVGIYDPVDPAAAVWDDFRVTTVPCADAGTFTHRITLLTDVPGIAGAAQATGAWRYDWRYPVSSGLAGADVPAVIKAVVEARRMPPAGTRLTTGLDTVLSAFAARLRAVSALLAVVLAGLGATLTGLILLTAGLIVRRRRDEFALIRARGGSGVTVAARCLAEALPVIPVAVAAGWFAGARLPGRAAGWETAAVVAVAVAGVLVVPVLAAPVRRIRGRRIVLDVLVVLLAVLGVLLLRRRGLVQASGIDPYLVAVPVLLAAAAALVVARVMPWALRVAGRGAGRTRGVVVFLGLGRAARGLAIAGGPLAVLVVAAATGIFTAAVATSVEQARDRHTGLLVGGDATVSGLAFEESTSESLRAVPGVDAVAAASLESGARLRIDTGTGTRELAQAQQMVLDGVAAAEILRQSGVDYRLPDLLTHPTLAGAAAVPAVVSPAIAEAVGEGALTEIRGRRFPFRVAAVADTFPGIAPGTREFIVLPWQSVPRTPIPNHYLIAGPAADPAALRTAGDNGQIAALAAELGRTLTPAGLPVATRVTVASQERAALGRGGVNGVLTVVLASGAIGGLLLVLLAVAITVTADAPARGRSLSRLRTMGLSTAQSRGLLLIELLPLVAAAVLTGTAVGVILPWLIAPALGLTAFTEGLPAPVRLDPVLAAALPPATLLILLTALLAEDRANRTLHLGALLRLGDN